MYTAIYTPRQASRGVMKGAIANPNTSEKEIVNLVHAKQTNERQLPERHFRAVCMEVLRFISTPH